MTTFDPPVFLDTLTVRGLRVTVRKHRVHVRPRRLSRTLTADERRILREHREAIADHLRVAGQEVTTPAAPCRWCYRSPCIGPKHSAYVALHPTSQPPRTVRPSPLAELLSLHLRDVPPDRVGMLLGRLALKRLLDSE